MSNPKPEKWRVKLAEWVTKNVVYYGKRRIGHHSKGEFVDVSELEHLFDSLLQQLRDEVEGMNKPIDKVSSVMGKKGIKGVLLSKQIKPMVIYNQAISDILTLIDKYK